MENFEDKIRAYMEKEKEVLEKLPTEDINKVINVLEEARKKGAVVYVCGNGGSAATAAHYVTDFNKGISYGQDIKYDIECLSDNVPMMMAIANDIGYDDIFVVPLRNKLKKGDIVIGISGSGNSENVIRAVSFANTQGAETITFTGYGGGRLKHLSKYNIHVAADNMQIVEDIHLVLNHMMMFILSGMKGC